MENKYPAWALNRMKMKINAPTSQDKNKRSTNISANATVKGPIWWFHMPKG